MKSKRDNGFTKEINETALISNDDKRMHTIDLVSKDEIRCNNIIKEYKNC